MNKKFLAVCGGLILLLLSLCSCGLVDPTPTPSPLPTLSATPFFSPTATLPSTPEPTPTAAEPSAAGIKRVALSRAHLLEGDWATKSGYNDAALRRLDTERLLYWFYDTAGLTELNEGNRPYADWESNYPHLGITMGHYITACAMYYAATGDEWYREKVDYCVAQLTLCQQPNGYLLAQPESRFDHLEAGDGIELAGVPYYFTHKLLAAFLDAYHYCGNEQAFETAKRLADWVYNRNKDLTALQITHVYAIEYGGIAESLYDLYELTGRETDLAAARFFNEPKLVSAWAAGSRALTGLHANSHIPKATAMWREYLVSGDEKYARAAKNFFDIVLEDQTFATGSNSNHGEAFWYPKREYETVSTSTDPMCETCNVYNMIKLAQYLYEYTGEMKYVDYIERGMMNAILGSENKNGGKTYYQWLYPNAKKVFNGKNQGFWCCTGTGFENFAKVTEAIYHERESELFVNLYISSDYTDGTLAFDMTCSDGLSELTVTAAGTKTIRLRAPYWAREAVLTVNGQPAGETVDGYVTVTRDWAVGDKLELSIPYRTYTRVTNDNPDAFSLFYGPYLMAADHKLSSNVLSGDWESGWLSDPDGLITPKEGGGYELTVDGNKLSMMRYGDIISQPYTVYFTRK